MNALTVTQDKSPVMYVRAKVKFHSRLFIKLKSSNLKACEYDGKPSGLPSGGVSTSH